jgi:hypothetical protein
MERMRKRQRHRHLDHGAVGRAGALGRVRGRFTVGMRFGGIRQRIETSVRIASNEEGGRAGRPRF